MQLRSIAVIIACVLANGLMASPLASRDTSSVLVDNEYVQYWSEPAKFNNGSIIYYGPSNTTATPTPTVAVDKRKSCPTTGTPSCHDSHAARNQPCDELVTELQGDGDVSVPQSPRQICYEGNSEKNSYCCVSWHNKVVGLTKADLFKPAYKIMTHCTTSGISGRIDNIMVDTTCTDVCLSNRGTGC